MKSHLVFVVLYMTKFKNLISNYFLFALDPSIQVYPNTSKKQKIVDVCVYYLFFQFIIGIIILWYPVKIAQSINLFNKLEEGNLNINYITTVISAIIVAPLIEEPIFRLSLGYYRETKYFKFLFYLSSFLFGFVHIFTYKFDTSHYLFIPFITASQISSGFMFGYIRIIYGFWYGVLQHSLFNLLGIIWMILVGF